MGRITMGHTDAVQMEQQPVSLSIVTLSSSPRNIGYPPKKKCGDFLQRFMYSRERDSMVQIMQERSRAEPLLLKWEADRTPKTIMGIALLSRPRAIFSQILSSYSAGADVNDTNRGWETALTVARVHGHDQAVQLLSASPTRG
jgi:hypothetical protein